MDKGLIKLVKDDTPLIAPPRKAQGNPYAA